jgi:hypothetical protein
MSLSKRWLRQIQAQPRDWKTSNIILTEPGINMISVGEVDGRMKEILTEKQRINEIF